MIDLHTHSMFSDGSLTPEQLVVEAKMAKLSAVALTDHDSVDGVDRFLAACSEHGIRGVPGVEISVDGEGDSVHILGYFIDHHNPALSKHLAGIRSNRDYRNKKILENLNGMGLALTMREVGEYAGSDNIGRLHFAQALVERGYVKTREEAFDRFLARGKPGYSNRRRLSPVQGIAMIRDADGLAVLAHPFTLGKGKEALTALIAELVPAGLAGLEVFYPHQNPRQMKTYKAIASKFNLLVTGGTDFHGAPMPDIRIGRGFGSLNVPDTVLEDLDARRKA
jgi:3',5'-nucleoside bisphosphate phosphatase